MFSLILKKVCILMGTNFGNFRKFYVSYYFLKETSATWELYLLLKKHIKCTWSKSNQLGLAKCRANIISHASYTAWRTQLEWFKNGKIMQINNAFRYVSEWDWYPTVWFTE